MYRIILAYISVFILTACEAGIDIRDPFPLTPPPFMFTDIDFRNGCADNRNLRNSISFKLSNASSESTLSDVNEIRVNYVTSSGEIRRALRARRGASGIPISDEYTVQRLPPRPIDTVHITLVAEDSDGNVLANTQKQIGPAPEIEHLIFIEARRFGRTHVLPAAWKVLRGLRDRNCRPRDPFWVLPVRMKNLKNPVLVRSEGGNWPRNMSTPKIERERRTSCFSEIEEPVPNDLGQYLITFPLENRDMPGSEITELSVSVDHNNPFPRCITDSSVSGTITQTAPVLVPSPR